MSRSVNKVILVGHLGRDAETNFIPNGIAVTKFSVATTHSWKDQSSDRMEGRNQLDQCGPVAQRESGMLSDQGPASLS